MLSFNVQQRSIQEQMVKDDELMTEIMSKEEKNKDKGERKNSMNMKIQVRK